LAANTIIMKNRIGFLLLATLMTAFSYRCLDADISLFVQRQLDRSALLERLIEGIPDLLLYLVLAITVLSWAGYFFLRRRAIHGREAKFLRACGTVAPLAFLSKAVLQYVFGRANPHLWLLWHLPPRFYWFHTHAGYGSFPSGHMTVFTALMCTLIHYYPRYRPAIAASLFLLALTLVVTNYHFLSDVIAGAVLGATLAFIINDKQTPGNRARDRA
jgi:membrane-associated phospholipid phosphatase